MTIDCLHLVETIVIPCVGGGGSNQLKVHAYNAILFLLAILFMFLKTEDDLCFFLYVE